MWRKSDGIVAGFHGRAVVAPLKRRVCSFRRQDWRIEYNTTRPQQPELARPGYLHRALGGPATRWILISGGTRERVRS